MTGPLADWDGVGLADLVSRAGLQTRVDRKYVLTLSELSTVLAGISGSVAVLDIEGRREFAYHSMYFDTPDLTCFRNHRQGRRRRFKVRTRLYLDSDLCMVEVKAPDARGRTVKYRIDHAPADADRLTQGSARFASEILGSGPTVAMLQPTLATNYRRITLLDLLAGGRVTIDVELGFECPPASSAGPDTGAVFVCPRDLVIVETKTAGARGVTDRLLWSAGSRPVSISKYCIGMALTHPELAANRWHRVLRRHFLPGERPRENRVEPWLDPYVTSG